MEKGFKLAAIFAVVMIMVFGSTLSAVAQTDNPVCAGLAAEECQLLTGATTAMTGVKSFAIPAWSADFTLDTGTPEESVTFSASGSGEIMLPADMSTSGLLVHFTLDDLTSTSAGATTTATGELIVLGNMVYVFSNGEWYGGEMTAEDQQSFQESLGGITGGDMGDMGNMTGLLATTATTEDVNGQAATRFTTTVDLNVLLPLLSDPATTESLGETGQQAQMMLMMFSSLLTGTTINFEQVIGQDDNFLHGIALNVDLPAAAEGGATFSGGLHFSADLAQHNETFTATPPDSFRPLEELDSELDLGM